MKISETVMKNPVSLVKVLNDIEGLSWWDQDPPTKNERNEWTKSMLNTTS